MFNKEKNHITEISAATCLLLGIAKSDDKLETSEINIVKEIIADFFQTDINEVEKIFIDSIEVLNNSTDFFEFSKTLNNIFSYQDKIDFICCAFEVAFSDGELHYIEEHFIKKIANSLNVEHKDLIKSKIEMKNYL